MWLGINGFSNDYCSIFQHTIVTFWIIDNLIEAPKLLRYSIAFKSINKACIHNTRDAEMRLLLYYESIKLVK